MIHSGADSCERLLADHLAAALERFGSAALSVVDLPPLSPHGPAPAQVRAAATLLWCRHVDEAGLLDFVDAIARGVVDGSLHAAIGGEVADEVVRYWRGREDRFDREERASLYARLFAGVDVLGLCRALAAIGASDHEGEERQARVRARVLAETVAHELSDRAVGMTGFAGREIVAHVRAAFDLLKLPGLEVVLGGLGPWQAIRMLSPTLLGRAIEPAPALARAQAGLTVVAWLAEQHEASDAVIAAAVAYVNEGRRS